MKHYDRCSPRSRGCFRPRGHDGHGKPVFPAHAGVFSSHIALAAAGAALGCIAWGDRPQALGYAPVLAVLWAMAPTRAGAFAAALTYYAGASRGIPAGAAIFFGDEASLLAGTALWLAASAALAAPWAVFWPKHGKGIAWRLSAALLAVSLPPIGIVGWANPLTAAGALLPGTKWAGLLVVWLQMIAFGIVAAQRINARHAALLALCIGAIAVTAEADGSHYQAPTAPVTGIDTRIPKSQFDSQDFLTAYWNHQALLAIAWQHAGEAAVLLPESVAGLWQNSAAALWERQKDSLPPVTFAGALEPAERGYSNTIVAITPAGSRIVYRQRLPVPVGMWRPWRPGFAVAHLRGRGTFDLDGTRYGALICYEQLMFWPVVQTFAEKPGVVLAPANSWWSKNTSIPGIQKSVMATWARLFDVPVATSHNF